LVSDDLLQGENSFGRSETSHSNGFTDDFLNNASNTIKIGIRREWGGSIVFFGMSGNSTGMNTTNTIDANDTGREVQVALYDPDRIHQGCAHNASCRNNGTTCPASITYLGWNPVQGGNRCNNGSSLSSIINQDGRLEINVQPLHWNPNWSFNDCTSTGCQDSNLSHLQSDVLMTQSLRFIKSQIVELKYQVQELAGLDHAKTNQEMPTVYSANGNNGPDLWRLMDANGNQIDINVPANDGFFMKNFNSSSSWVSLQNDNLDYGVGILYENGITAFQGWQNRSLPFNNVRAAFPFAVPAYSTIFARAYLLIGSFTDIQNLAEQLLNDLPPFGALDAPVHSATINNLVFNISGWALDNRGVQSVRAVIDERLSVPLNYGQSRTDVCKVWPGYPNCDLVGFSGTADIGILPSALGCAHQIEIIATDTDRNERVISKQLIYLE